jgi:hypothetical protein
VQQPETNPDAFNAFEAAGWEEKAAGYDVFLGAITSRVAEPVAACRTASDSNAARPALSPLG